MRKGFITEFSLLTFLSIGQLTRNQRQKSRRLYANLHTIHTQLTFHFYWEMFCTLILLIYYNIQESSTETIQNIKHFRFVLGKSYPCPRLHTSSLENRR